MKQRVDFCRKVRKGERITPVTAFEWNYYLCWNFKKKYKGIKSEDIIEQLYILSRVKLEGNKQSYDKRRQKKHPSRKKCWICVNQACYQHHIILLKNGGFDSGINRIPTCEGCHKHIHPWLN